MAKFRSGFVSNSSSSSFILTLPHEPTSSEEVRKIMFSGIEDLYGLDVGDAAQTVFDRLEISKITEIENIHQAFEDSISWMEYDDLVCDEENYPFRIDQLDYWDAIRPVVKEVGIRKYNDHIKKHPGIVYSLSFEDSPLEELDNFTSVECIRVRG
jgi:hypothetical protein